MAKLTDEQRKALQAIELYAWVGEDERSDSGIIGIKQARTRAGYIPLVATAQGKMLPLSPVMKAQATISLVRFTFAEVIQTVPIAEDPAKPSPPATEAPTAEQEETRRIDEEANRRKAAELTADAEAQDKQTPRPGPTRSYINREGKEIFYEQHEDPEQQAILDKLQQKRVMRAIAVSDPAQAVRILEGKE